MKKILVFATLMTAVICANAQLQVDGAGKVGIKTTGNINSLLSINCNGSSEMEFYATGTQKGIHSNVNNSVNYSGWGTAVEGFAIDNSSSYRVGVHGAAYNNSLISGRTYGVLGRAGGANGSRNYSIFGQLVKTSNGAAIYGTTTTSDLGEALDQRYAGYFIGPVKVTGNLTVNGNINGVLLSQSQNSLTATSLSKKNGSRISTLLQYIEPHTFLWELNHQDLNQSISEREQSLGNDTITRETNVGLIEKQILTKQHYGLNADQLEEVFPDLVYEQEDGTKSINYVELVPILVQAINELRGEIEELRAGGDDRTKKAVQPSSEGDSAEKLLLLSLGQNKPNPFSNATTIEVCIPEEVQKAFIYVYDLQGKKVEQVDITTRGKQNVLLSSANLTDGMYLYSLIADGKVVETRRMIVEK